MSRLDRYQGFKRLLTSAMTANSFGITAGFKTAGAGTGYGYIPGGGGRGLIVGFFGTDTANQTGSFELFPALTADGKEALENPDDLLTLKYGAGTFTLGTCTGGGASTVITSSELVADTVTWTVGTFGTQCETAYGLGAVTAFSPADNTPGCLIIPHVPACGLIVSLKDDGSAASVNAFWARVRT